MKLSTTAKNGHFEIVLPVSMQVSFDVKLISRPLNRADYDDTSSLSMTFKVMKLTFVGPQ